jgi:MFS family permease
LAGAGKVEDVAAPGAALWWVWPLLATLIMQATAAFLTRLIPTLAPALLDELSWSETAIGYLASLGTVGSILFLFAGAPLIRRAGPIRALQIGIGLGIVGIAALALPFAFAAALGALLIGFGYGPSTPAGSEVLQRHAPARHRNLVFSIKQAGVPIGGVLAGVALPMIAEALGWRAALVFAALVAIAASPRPSRCATGSTPSATAACACVPASSSPSTTCADRSLRSAARARCSAWPSSAPASPSGKAPGWPFLVTYLVARLGLTLPQAASSLPPCRPRALPGGCCSDGWPTAWARAC